MAMSNGGMTKLVEECSELITVLAKRIAYPEAKFHPDNNYVLLDVRIEDEMGDVLAALYFVRDKIGLSDHDIHARMVSKAALYQKWDKE